MKETMVDMYCRQPPGGGVIVWLHFWGQSCRWLNVKHPEMSLVPKWTSVDKHEDVFLLWRCSVSAAAPPPVLTVSPSWLTPGASVTLTCGGVPHPTAGWRFYWYRADPISLDQAPSCPQSIQHGRRDINIPKFSYELLPGSDGGTEQNSFVIQGLTESAGYSCRAGRGDPVFYTEYSETKWVWSGGEFVSFSWSRCCPFSRSVTWGTLLWLVPPGDSLLEVIGQRSRQIQG